MDTFVMGLPELRGRGPTLDPVPCLCYPSHLVRSTHMAEKGRAKVTRSENTFREWHRRVAGLVFRLGVSADEVDNLTAEALTQFLEAGYQLPADKSVLFVIAERRATDFHRDRERRKRMEKALAAQVRGDDPCTPLHIAEAEEEAALVEVCLNHLPRGEQVVVVLRAMYRWSWQAICDLLCITDSAAKGRYKRGLAEMRSALAVRRLRG